MKGGLLPDSYVWILEQADFVRWRHNADSRLLWITGDPGKGKTMLICGIIKELEKSASNMSKAQLPCYFFCQASDTRLNSATAVLRGILFLLADQHSTLFDLNILERYRRMGESLFTDINAWSALSTIFADMINDPILAGKVFIIDALDECKTDQERLLKFIVNATISSQTKWLISSRNQSDIANGLRRVNLESKLANSEPKLVNLEPRFISLELKANAEQVGSAVNRYIDRYTSTLLVVENNETLLKSIRDKIRHKAEGTFLWAALVIQELRNGSEWEVEDTLADMPPGLEELYSRMVSQITLLKPRRREFCQRILASVITAYQPLRLEELEGLLDLPADVQELVRNCGSFLIIRDHTIYFIHQSAKDFLLENEAGHILLAGLLPQHNSLFSSSVKVLSKKLRRNIYGLDHLGTLVEDISPLQSDPLVYTRYSCEFWVDHLGDAYQLGDVDDKDHSIILDFFKCKFLYWLEALSLIGIMSKGVGAVEKLLRILASRHYTAPGGYMLTRSSQRRNQVNSASGCEMRIASFSSTKQAYAPLLSRPTLLLWCSVQAAASCGRHMHMTIRLGYSCDLRGQVVGARAFRRSRATLTRSDRWHGRRMAGR